MAGRHPAANDSLTPTGGPFCLCGSGIFQMFDHHLLGSEGQDDLREVGVGEAGMSRACEMPLLLTWDDDEQKSGPDGPENHAIFFLTARGCGIPRRASCNVNQHHPRRRVAGSLIATV